MGIEIANVWHFDIRLYLKSALGELYKKDTVCTKIRLFKIQNRKIFLGPQTPPPVGRGTPPPHTPPLSAPSAPRSPRLRRSHLPFPELFFRKQPLVSAAENITNLRFTLGLFRPPIQCVVIILLYFCTYFSF